MFVTTAPDQQNSILQFLPRSSNGYTQQALMMVHVINIRSMHIDRLLVFFVDTLHSISK